MRIKELRKLIGIKQGALARDLNVSQPTVSDWEAGNLNPSIDNLIRISNYFGVTVGCVIGTEPIPEGFPESHVRPVIYTEAIEKQKTVAEDKQTFKPAKKLPFNKEQIAYLDEWGDRLTEKIVCSLKEDTFLLKETGTEEN